MHLGVFHDNDIEASSYNGSIKQQEKVPLTSQEGNYDHNLHYDNVNDEKNRNANDLFHHQDGYSRRISYKRTSTTKNMNQPRRKSSTAFSVVPSSVANKVSNAYVKLFGNNYNQRQSNFVLVAGGLIAFNNGYVNGSCLSGLLLPNGATQSVAGFTSSYTKSALSLVQGEWSLFGYHSLIILSYMLGAAIAGYITPNAKPYRIEPTYGPTFLIGGIFLLLASILSAFDYSEQYVFFFAAAANGIQNGIASIYSANLIRCSLTGSSTDIALVIGHIAKGYYNKLWKGAVLSMIVSTFWLGGIVSFYATSYFRELSLFVNAGLFWLVGLSLLIFLVNELHISFIAAIFGTWKWKNALKMLHDRMMISQHGPQYFIEDDREISDYDSTEFHQLFDRIDHNNKGTIEVPDLISALNDAGYDGDEKDVKTLMMVADENNDGNINRDEWMALCRTIRDSTTSATATTTTTTTTTTQTSARTSDFLIPSLWRGGREGRGEGSEVAESDVDNSDLTKNHSNIVSIPYGSAEEERTD